MRLSFFGFGKLPSEVLLITFSCAYGGTERPHVGFQFALPGPYLVHSSSLAVGRQKSRQTRATFGTVGRFSSRAYRKRSRAHGSICVLARDPEPRSAHLFQPLNGVYSSRFCCSTHGCVEQRLKVLTAVVSYDVPQQTNSAATSHGLAVSVHAFATDISSLLRIGKERIHPIEGSAAQLETTSFLQSTI